VAGRPLGEHLPLTVGTERHGLNMSTTPSGFAPSLSGAALLWDLDNVASARDDLSLLAMTLSGFVDAGAPRIAAAHWPVFKECRATLRGLGFRVLSGGNERDGADDVLLRQARRLKRKGVARFIVVSNDRRFARIANFAELHVLTLTGPYLSERLRTAARTVTLLGQDEWRCGGAEEGVG
jgi:hypothetical protein